MSFQQGLSGLNAAGRTLDVIGNNVANANTVGFKGSQAIFADAYAASLAGAGGNSAGIGTNIVTVQQHFNQGNVTSTSSPTDVAINQAGFFRLDTNGVITYSRNGQFHLDKNGFLVNASGQNVTGYGVDSAGTVVQSTPAPISISTADLTPTPTSLAAMTLNLNSGDPVIVAPFVNTDPTTYNHTASMTVYDSLGNAHALGTYFVKTASNTWSVYASADGVALAPPLLGTLSFNTDGSLDITASATPYAVSVPLANGATTPLAFTLDFKGATQFGSPYGVNSQVQDGFASGRLAGYGISPDGTIQGRYSNGQSRALGQLVLASFTNPEGLQPIGNNGWAETGTSGQPIVGAPGSGTLGTVQSGAIEESNVDLTKELVDMITAQRVYQANAQTIKTQDQVLNTLVNLR